MKNGIRTLRQEQNLAVWTTQVEECNNSGLSVAQWCRENFLFANTESGTQDSAVMYSIIETAKENNLDPYKYLTYIFSKAPNLKEDETIDILLPWNVPEECKSHLRKGDDE